MAHRGISLANRLYSNFAMCGRSPLMTAGHFAEEELVYGDDLSRLSENGRFPLQPKAAEEERR